MQLQDFLKQASQLPSLSLDKLFLFIRFAHVCTPYMRTHQISCSLPQRLPPSVRTLLAAALQENHAYVDSLWAVLGDYIWKMPSEPASVLPAEEISVFNGVALPQGICEYPALSKRFFFTAFFPVAYRHQLPPTRVCLRSRCSRSRLDAEQSERTLTNPSTHPATLFTLREGALPIFTTSTYCRGEHQDLFSLALAKEVIQGCFTRYHPNYFVHSQTGTRTYYSGIPSAIQVAKHCYMDTALLELFTSTSVHGW